MNPNKQTNKQLRIREFDAIRGLSILLVVFGHVLYQNGASGCITAQFFTGFRMPLFFFISGFFAYRAMEVWHKELYTRIFTQKIKAQIFCPIIFYALLKCLKDQSPFGWIENGFQEYWFTIALFQMFTVYALVVAVSKKAKQILHFNITFPILIIIALIGLVNTKLNLSEGLRISNVLAIENVSFYLQFFVLGLLVHRYEAQFYRVVRNSYIKTFLIAFVTASFCYGHSNQIPRIGFISQLTYITPHCEVLLIVSIFMSARDFFYRDNIVSKSLCFTGQRTLDIYMLHYFFIPIIPSIISWLTPDSRVLLQIIVTGTFALAITSICLLISNILRQSHVIAEWLFGVRKRINIEN